MHWRATFELSLWRIADLDQIYSGSDYDDWSTGRDHCHMANWSPDLLLLAQEGTIHPRSALQQQQTTRSSFQRGVFLYLIKLITGIWFTVKHAACSMLQQVPKASAQLSWTMTLCYRVYSGHQEASRCREKRQKHQTSSAGNRHSMCAKQRESSDVTRARGAFGTVEDMDG